MITSWEDPQKRIDEAIALFPEIFGLRAFPGDVFRISRSFSYVNDSDVLQLATEVKRGDAWLSFAKGEIAELTDHIVPLQVPFVAIGPAVMQGQERAATARSKTMAKRIANALNKHTPNREGV